MSSTNYIHNNCEHTFFDKKFTINSDYVPFCKLEEALVGEELLIFNSSVKFPNKAEFSRVLMNRLTDTYSNFKNNFSGSIVNKIANNDSNFIDGNYSVLNSISKLLIIKKLIETKPLLNSDYNILVSTDYPKMNALVKATTFVNFSLQSLSTIFNSTTLNREMKSNTSTLVFRSRQNVIYMYSEVSGVLPIGFIGIEKDKVDLALRLMKLGLPIKKSWLKVIIHSHFTSKECKEIGIRNSLRKSLKIEGCSIVLEDNLFISAEPITIGFGSLSEKQEKELNFKAFLKQNCSKAMNTLLVYE
jgi:hypothetical protein